MIAKSSATIAVGAIVADCAVTSGDPSAPAATPPCAAPRPTPQHQQCSGTAATDICRADEDRGGAAGDSAGVPQLYF